MHFVEFVKQQNIPDKYSLFSVSKATIDLNKWDTINRKGTFSLCITPKSTYSPYALTFFCTTPIEPTIYTWISAEYYFFFSFVRKNNKLQTQLVGQSISLVNENGVLFCILFSPTFAEINQFETMESMFFFLSFQTNIRRPFWNETNDFSWWKFSNKSETNAVLGLKISIKIGNYFYSLHLKVVCEKISKQKKYFILLCMCVYIYPFVQSNKKKTSPIWTHSHCFCFFLGPKKKKT